MLDQHRDYVLRTVEERGVRLVRLWFTDVLGNLKSFAISPAELENALEDGMTFDGSSIDGFSRIQEADVLAIPDPDTFELLPWGDQGAAEARVFCDIHSLDGAPFQGDPRQVLRRHVQAAHDQGLTFYIAPDIEFFYFENPQPGEKPKPLDQGGYFDLTTLDATGDLRKQTIRKLEQMSIPVEYSFHEDSPSQQEIDLRHTDALTMADSVMTFRLIVKEVAASQGVHATFMPKPLEAVQGSGMHLHMSLFRGDDNAFYDADDEHTLSKEAKSFMAGLLVHAAEFTAITNQTVNSYKRLVPGFEAPVHISWARNNRSGLIRVPVAKKGNPLATRLEFRSPDPACNPYLAFSVLLAAGLKGIQEGYELPEEADANLFEMDDAALRKLGITQLPQSLSDALARMEESELVREALGEHIFEWFLRNKRREWRDYKTHVSQFELDRYLGVGVMAGTTRSNMLAVFADPVPPELARSLDLAGFSWKGVGSVDDANDHEPTDGWQGAIIDCSADPEGAWAFARTVRKAEGARLKVLVLVGGAQLGDLNLRDDLFDDFCLSPFHPTEFEARLRHLLWSTGEPAGPRTDLVEYGDLVLNLETYQATIAGRPLDLTYMEYELLKFLAQNPGKVFTREILLSRVWGYEYYGGARTVDVHIRRLRAKLGEEFAGLIATVRSVGYRFGQSRWGN